MIGKRNTWVGRGWVVAGALYLVGCGIGGTSFESPVRTKRPNAAHVDPQSSALEALSARAVESPLPEMTDIELLWEVPAEPVDGYIVRYGNFREQLSVEKKVLVGELEKRDDPERGSVYRYVIRGIPSTQRIFLSVATFRGDAVSLPSRVFEVFPGSPV